MKNAKHWDIFCKVIDNFGDIGVCWRLCCDLAARGCQIRLWLDDPQALHWMAPNGHAGVQIIHWTKGWSEGWQLQAPWPNVVLEGFGCGPDPDYLAQWDRVKEHPSLSSPPIWINLEYLSAEPYVERSHGLSSPTVQHAWLSQKKFFFYPGFTTQTGGLLRELDLNERRRQFDTRSFWATYDPVGAKLESNNYPVTRVSLFSYHNAPVLALMENLLAQPSHSGQWVVLVTPGQAQEAAQLAQSNASMMEAQRAGRLRWVELPYLSQKKFDELLWACDLNLVRGEDSLVRALWAQKPFLWHLYQQDDASQFSKLEAFLEMAQLPPDWSAWMRVWNRPASTPLSEGAFHRFQANWKNWQPYARQLAQRLETPPDLTSQLLQFIAEKQ